MKDTVGEGTEFGASSHMLSMCAAELYPKPKSTAFLIKHTVGQSHLKFRIVIHEDCHNSNIRNKSRTNKQTNNLSSQKNALNKAAADIYRLLITSTFHRVLIFSTKSTCIYYICSFHQPVTRKLGLSPFYRWGNMITHPSCMVCVWHSWYF